jgi:hypothetical protein
MNSVRLIVALSTVVSIVLGAASVSGAQPVRGPIPHPGPPSAQRAVAEEWVRYMDSGDRRDACALQTVGEVDGRPCTELPTREVLRCPKHGVIRRPKANEVLMPYEQVGVISEEGPISAFAVLRSERKGSRIRGALGLALQSGVWRVSYLRQGESIYVPAVAVWQSEAWRKLWYPASCSLLS